MASSRRLGLVAAALALAVLQPASADPVPQVVTHGSIWTEGFPAYGRCRALLSHFAGTFLVGKKVWHGEATTKKCAYAATDVGDPEMLLYGDSQDGTLYLDCVTNAPIGANTYGGAPGDPALFVCRASLNGAFPLPVVFEMKTHHVSGDYYAGSFYGA